MKIDRRRLVGNLARSATGIACLTQLPALFSARPAVAEAGAPARRFIQFFLSGGWDSMLATDPPVGVRATNGNFQADYQSLEVKTVPGKANLIVGNGLVPALNAFSTMSTAFVNSLYVEVPAHDLAGNHILSGKLSLSRSREYPSFIALMGQASGAFPPHLDLGGSIPLGDTRAASPPLAAGDMDSLISMLKGPHYDDAERAWRVDEANELIATLDNLRYADLGERGKKRLDVWTSSGKALADVYAGRYADAFDRSDETKARYGFANGWDVGGLVATAFFALKSGLTSYSSVVIGGFDTHMNHLQDHVPRMRVFAAALNALVADLRATPDPADGAKSLADTTTILITSEFTRTPLFNSTRGTDHWTSASAVVMGAGVKDNAVIGKTANDGDARGWVNGAPVALTDETRLMPDHLAASIAAAFGFSDVATRLGGVTIDGLFL